MFYIRNFKKLSEVLGWQPKVSLEAGIKKTILWYKRNKTKDTKRTDL
jgi:dTDP-D-glucose 4,6-dehydratase